MIGGFVAECSNTSLYSPAIQSLTGLPVWDSVGLINWLHASSRAVSGSAPSLMSD